MSDATAPGGIGGATGVGAGIDRTATPANLAKAGKRFEAMFTGMMLKSMRQAKLADPLFDSKAIDTFTEMSDAKVAAAMAEHQPLGIGKAMTDYLAKHVGGAATGSGSGTDAAQPSLNRGDAKPSP